MPQMLHEHFACARSGPFPFRSRSVPRSVFGPAFPAKDEYGVAEFTFPIAQESNSPRFVQLQWAVHPEMVVSEKRLVLQ